MGKSQLRSIIAALAAPLLLTAAAAPRAVVAPFDFSRHEIGLSVSVHGTPLYMFLDTGVSPSAIDTDVAKALGLKIDFAGGGEASGQGADAHMMVYPTTIDEVTFGGRRFGPIEALAASHKAITHAYGRTVDGTLGHSFLTGHVVVIDYAAQTIAIADREADVTAQLSSCRRVWRTRLKSYKGDTIPMVDLQIGKAHLPTSLDTGSDGVVELFKGALDDPAVKAALSEAGTTKETGARGEYAAKAYKSNAPIRLGPFVLPAGESVTLIGDQGTAATRLANLGNRLLADMKVRLLLDYRDNRLGLYGDCAP